MTTKINVRAVYGNAPVEALAVQCPICHNWFAGYDVCEEIIEYDYQINGYNEFYCPMCEKPMFESQRSCFDKVEFNIEEMNDHKDVYKDCKKKRTVWE